MTKAKKPVTVSSQITQLQGLVTQLTQRLDQHDEALNDHEGEIAQLEEAICPRVAARLTALERAIQPKPTPDQRNVAVGRVLQAARQYVYGDDDDNYAHLVQAVRGLYE